MKGQPESALWLHIEGGTIGNLTLRVSDMPTLNPGDRAVFFTDPGPSGANVPHLRGFGISKLDAETPRPGGEQLTLDD